MNEEQIHILKHSWGFDSRNPGYRNRYCGSTKDTDLKALVITGYMVGPQHVGNFGDNAGMFYLTDKAVEFLQALKKETK